MNSSDGPASSKGHRSDLKKDHGEDEFRGSPDGLKWEAWKDNLALRRQSKAQGSVDLITQTFDLDL